MHNEPIDIEVSFSSFLSTNSPPKSVKLNSPIDIVWRFSQSSIWNDLSVLFPNPNFFWVNEFFPMSILVSLCNPLIRNVLAEKNESSPIISVFKFSNWERSKVEVSSLLQVQSGSTMRSIRGSSWSMYSTDTLWEGKYWESDSWTSTLANQMKAYSPELETRPYRKN